MGCEKEEKKNNKKKVESVQSNINVLLADCIRMYKCNEVTLKICF